MYTPGHVLCSALQTQVPFFENCRDHARMKERGWRNADEGTRMKERGWKKERGWRNADEGTQCIMQIDAMDYEN